LTRGLDRRRAWGFLVAAIVLEVSATLSLRGALDEPWLYVVVVLGYVASFAALASCLRAGMGLGVAYGIWGAMGVALTAVLSWWLFHEPLTPLMVAGIVVIMAGVLCIELGSQAALRLEVAPGAEVER
jgi:small multidrug resistance pump